MKWEEIRSLLKYIEYFEIVPKDEKLMKDVDKDQKDKNIDMEDQEDKGTNVNDQKDIEEISYPCLDENGVWVKDNKEEKNLSLMAQATNKEKEAQGTMENGKGALSNFNYSPIYINANLILKII